MFRPCLRSHSGAELDHRLCSPTFQGNILFHRTTQFLFLGQRYIYYSIPDYASSENVAVLNRDSSGTRGQDMIHSTQKYQRSLMRRGKRKEITRKEAPCRLIIFEFSVLRVPFLILLLSGSH